jgi:hypothetical protein
MLPALTSPADAVQLIMVIGCTIMGISHIAQPRMWADFFAAVHRQGHAGLVAKVMLVELWPALLIVTLHQVWSGPAIVLTIYGWLLLIKVAVSLVLPSLPMRALAIPSRSPKRAFVPGGIALLAVAALTAFALTSPS